MAQVGAVGQRLEATFLNEDGSARDISGAATIEIYVTRPDLTTEVLTAAFETDGADGVVYASTTVDTLPAIGRYAYQGYVTDTDDSFTGFSSRYQLDVGRSPTVVP